MNDELAADHLDIRVVGTFVALAEVAERVGGAVHPHEALAAADRVVKCLLAVGRNRRVLVAPGVVRSPVVSNTNASHWPILSGSNNRPSLDATTSNPCSLPISVKIRSASPGFPSLRVMTECWNPELLVKKRTFLVVPLGWAKRLLIARRPASPPPPPATIDDDSGQTTSLGSPFKVMFVREYDQPVLFTRARLAKETRETAECLRILRISLGAQIAFRLRTCIETINVES